VHHCLCTLHRLINCCIVWTHCISGYVSLVVPTFPKPVVVQRVVPDEHDDVAGHTCQDSCEMHGCLWDDVRCCCWGRPGSTQGTPQDSRDPHCYDPGITRPNTLCLRGGSDTTSGLVIAVDYSIADNCRYVCAGMACRALCYMQSQHEHRAQRSLPTQNVAKAMRNNLARAAMHMLTCQSDRLRQRPFSTGCRNKPSHLLRAHTCAAALTGG
jgi:hypothetical protein